MSINLIQCPIKTWQKYFVHSFTEDVLAQVYIDVIKEYKDYPSIERKCILLIEHVNDYSLLKEMCIHSKHFAFINEILLKLNSYSHLKEIKESRPDLETHVSNRIRLCTNSILFIAEED